MRSIQLWLLFSIMFLFGCAPAQPQSISPTVAPPIEYEYKHQMIDVSASCQPDDSTQATLLSKFYKKINQFGKDQSNADLTVDKVNEILSAGEMPLQIREYRDITSCVQAELERKLVEQEANGWELTSFQALSSNPYELGVEYTFIAIWRKQK